MSGGHDVTSTLVEVGNEIGGPQRAAVSEPGGDEGITAVLGEHAVDSGVVGLGRGRAEGERDRAESQLEQAIAAPRLAVIVALGRGAGEDLDLAIVESETLVDRA